MKLLTGQINPELNNIITNYSDWFFSVDRSIINLHGEPDPKEYYTSQEYLQKEMKTDHIGYPMYQYGMHLGHVFNVPDEYIQKFREVDKKLNTFLGSKLSAIKMYYPKNGYISWHNNKNCPGYNVLLSYTETGNGFFKYICPETKEEIIIEDTPGWSVKVGYFGEEPDNICWHCARAYEERLTLAYVIPDYDMWKMTCDDLML